MMTMIHSTILCQSLINNLYKQHQALSVSGELLFLDWAKKKRFAVTTTQLCGILSNKFYLIIVLLDDSLNVDINLGIGYNHKWRNRLKGVCLTVLYDEKLLTEEQTKIDNAFRSIGEQYYAAHQDETDNQFAEYFAVIKASENKMAEHRAMVMKANGLMI